MGVLKYKSEVNMDNSEELKAVIVKIKEYEASSLEQDVELKGGVRALSNFRIQLDDVKCNPLFNEDGRTEEELKCMDAILEDVVAKCMEYINSLTNKAAESEGEKKGLDKAISIIENMGEPEEEEEEEEEAEA